MNDPPNARLNGPIGNDLPSASIGNNTNNGLPSAATPTNSSASFNGRRNSTAESSDALNTMDDIEVMLANLSNQLDAMLTQGKN